HISGQNNAYGCVIFSYVPGISCTPFFHDCNPVHLTLVVHFLHSGVSELLFESRMQPTWRLPKPIQGPCSSSQFSSHLESNQAVPQGLCHLPPPPQLPHTLS
ncbi:mCG144972, partial [Mus musculus]